MMRGLNRSLLIAVFAAAALAAAGAAAPAGSSAPSPLVGRFLSLPDPDIVNVRAVRHLSAHNDRFNSSATMTVRTERDRAHGFRYTVLEENGSPYIRSKVFRATLDAEGRVCDAAEEWRAALTEANYDFDDRGEEADGLARLWVKPRRRDPLLFEGSLFVKPDDADLVRLEGRLTKSPSFWARQVQIVRSFRRIGGVRLPVTLETVATLFVAGKSTFLMTYDYEIVNGQDLSSSSKLTAR
jgi:hypothetical protein